MKRFVFPYVLPVFMLLSLTGLIFVLSNNTNQKVDSSKAAEITTPTPPFVQVGQFFEDTKDEAVVITNQNLPKDLQKDEACIVNGEVVKEGTVSSNTICVNEATPTP